MGKYPAIRIGCCFGFLLTLLTHLQRIEPYGWDSKDRTYFVLDDNRVYRLTEAPPTSQNQSKKKKKNLQQYGRRSSKRRRTERGIQEVGTVETEFNDDMADEGVQEGLGGMKWECIAISLEQVRDLIQDFRNHRDPNEKILQQQLEVHLIPILEKQEESRKRRALQRDRDLANLAKMANAKRSSRIANKVEQQKQEDKLKEEEKNARIAEQARIKEERARLRQEQQREVRMASRETRLKEREARRKLYTEELAQLSAEDSKRGDAASGRASERRIQAEIEKNKQALEALDDEDEDWVFDCICGLFGQVDDGTHSVACETCNVWQHSKCLGISEEEAERPEFHFLCKSCRNRQDPDTRQRPLIKLKVNRQTETESQAPETNGAGADESVSRVGSAPGPAGLSSASGSTTTNRPEQPSITHAVGVEASLTQTPIRASIKPVTIDRANGNQAKEDTLSPSTSSSAQPKSISEGLAPVAPKTSTPLTRPFHEHKLLPGPASNTPEGGHGLFPPITGEGNTPSQAGISPVKPPSHDAPTPVSSKVAGITSSNITSAGTPISPNTMRLPPGVTLAPSPQQPILTPPIKHPEPVRAPIDNKSQHWNDGQPTYQPTN